jgi:hypothetical protein
MQLKRLALALFIASMMLLSVALVGAVQSVSAQGLPKFPDITPVINLGGGGGGGGGNGGGGGGTLPPLPTLPPIPRTPPPD